MEFGSQSERTVSRGTLLFMAGMADPAKSHWISRIVKHSSVIICICPVGESLRLYVRQSPCHYYHSKTRNKPGIKSFPLLTLHAISDCLVLIAPAEINTVLTREACCRWISLRRTHLVGLSNSPRLKGFSLLCLLYTRRSPSKDSIGADLESCQKTDKSGEHPQARIRRLLFSPRCTGTMWR
jgi:hypothetical protein